MPEFIPPILTQQQWEQIADVLEEAIRMSDQGEEYDDGDALLPAYEAICAALPYPPSDQFL